MHFSSCRRELFLMIPGLIPHADLSGRDQGGLSRSVVAGAASIGKTDVAYGQSFREESC